MGDRRTEPESSGRIKVASFAILASAAVVKVLIEAHPGLSEFLASYTFKFVPHLLDLLLDALLIAAIIAYLSETRLLKNYFERRIQQLTSQAQETLEKRFNESLRQDFTSRVGDVEYLRQFDESFLKQAEAAIRRAFFARNLPAEVETFLGTLSALRETLTVWRSNYRIIATYEDVPGRTDIYKFITELRWTYVNYSQEPHSFTQALTEPLLPINGVQLADQYRRTKLEVDGRELLTTLTTKTRTEGHKTIVEAEFPITVPPVDDGRVGGVTYLEGAEVLQRKSEPFVLTFYRPVHTLTVSLHHPTHVMPYLYIFGISAKDEDIDPMDPTEATDTYHRWEYNGWLLPHHGAVLVFAER